MDDEINDDIGGGTSYLLFGGDDGESTPDHSVSRSPQARGKIERKSSSRGDRTRNIPILPDDRIESEYDLTRLLPRGTYHVHDLMDAIQALGLAGRNDGWGPAANGTYKFEHRVHGAVKGLRRQGLAQRRGDGFWFFEGTLRRPQRATFVIMGDPTEITLALGAAARMTDRIEEPVDFILCDPPWQLGDHNSGNAGKNGKQRQRDYSRVIDAYQDVPPNVDYLEFSQEWMSKAAPLLRPGGTMAIVTNAERSGDVQRAGYLSGLKFQNSIVIQKQNYVPIAYRKFAPAHQRMTVLINPRGGVDERTFNPLPEFGFTAAGDPYPQDVWTHIPNYDRRGLLRYSNQLSPMLVDAAIRTYTNRGDFVVDFFNGGGTTPLVCLLRGRRCFSSDIEPDSLRFTMGRILDVVHAQQAELSFGDTFADSVALRIGV